MRVCASVLALAVGLLLPLDRGATPRGLPAPNVNEAAPHATARPKLDGAFIVTEYVDGREVESFVDDMVALGLDTAIVYATRTIAASCDPASFSWLDGLPDKLQPLLSAASRRGLKIYIGLTSTAFHCHSRPAVFYEGDLSQAAIADTGRAVRYLEDLIGHEPALAGWFLPDEAALVVWQLDLVFAHYRGLVDVIRAQSTRPVLISPYLNGSRSSTPAEIARRVLQFHLATGVDIQILQDSVGADSTDLDDGTLASIYAHVSAKLGPSRVWAATELFGRIDTPAGPQFTPGPLARLERQLAQTPAHGVARRIAWIPQEHMTRKAVPATHVGAARLLASYEATYLGRGAMAKPVGYRWMTAPADPYPDDRKMFDGRTGHPLDFQHSGWVGIPAWKSGGAELEVDFGREVTLDWVGAHVLSYDGAGIAYPAAVSLSCSRDGATWRLAGRWSPPVMAGNGDQTISNPTELGVTCRSARLRFESSGWVFVSEVEFTQSGDDRRNLTRQTPDAEPQKPG